MQEDTPEMPIEGYEKTESIEKYQHKSSIIPERVRDFLSDERVFAVLDFVTKTKQAFQSFVDKPGSYNFFMGIFALSTNVIETMRFDAQSYFYEDWVTLTDRYGCQLMDIAIEIFSKLPKTVYKTSSKDHYIVIHHCPGGYDVGWVSNNNSRFVHVYARVGEEDRIDEYIRSVIWDMFGYKSVVLSFIESSTSKSNHDSIGFSEDNTFEALDSEKAVDLAKTYELYKAAGIPRSILFYGRPGTGKSTLIRTLVKKLQLRSLTVGSDDINRLGFSNSLYKIIEILKPEAIVFDDIDRLDDRNSKTLLEFTERVYKQVKFVFTTVNVVNRLDEAMIRPGRTDEIVEIEFLDKVVVESVLGEFADQYENVKTWPIAFVREFATRCKVVGPSIAKSTMQELAQRVANLSKKRRYTDLQLVSGNVDDDGFHEDSDDESDEDEDESDDSGDVFEEAQGFITTYTGIPKKKH